MSKINRDGITKGRLDTNPEMMREVMMNLDEVLSMVPLIANRASQAAGEQGLSKQGQSTYENFAKNHMEANFRTVFGQAESPIETLFLSSLCMSFAMYDPFSAEFTPPINVEESLNVFPEMQEASTYMWNSFQERSKSHSVDEFIHDVRAFFNTIPEAGENAADRIIHHHILYNICGLSNEYHLTLQPQMDIQVKGKNIRPDLYIWLPSDPKFKLIVECDGFQFHSDRKAFSNDRMRDRILQQNGFQVFRFSGHEIYHNPAGKAIELFEHLQSIKEKK